MLSDTLPGYEASAWYGIGAPKNTPAELIERLNKGVRALGLRRLIGSYEDLAYFQVGVGVSGLSRSSGINRSSTCGLGGRASHAIHVAAARERDEDDSASDRVFGGSSGP